MRAEGVREGDAHDSVTPLLNHMHSLRMPNMSFQPNFRTYVNLKHISNE